MTTVVDELQKLLAGPANLTTDEAVAVAMAIALLKAQAAQTAQTPQNYVWVVYNKVASMYFWSEDAARKAATFTGSLGMDVSRIDLLDVAAQPAHAHAIDTSPERVEKQAGNVQVPEGYKLVPVNCCPGSPGWPIALRDSTIDVITDGCFQAVGYQGTTALMRAVARAVERHHGIAAPSTKEDV